MSLRHGSRSLATQKTPAQSFPSPPHTQPVQVPGITEKKGPAVKKPNVPIKSHGRGSWGHFPNLSLALLLLMGEETNFQGKHPGFFMIQHLSVCATYAGPNTHSFLAISKYSRSVCGLFIANNPVIDYL